MSDELPRRPQTEAPESWRALFDAVGGRAGLARELEVCESTVYRWSRAVEPPPAVARLAINTICDRFHVERIFA